MTDITYARVVKGTVHGDPITLPDDVKLGVDLFSPDEAALYHPCGSDIRDGWSYDGKAFSAPVSPPVDLRAYAASARYAKETAGITVGTAQIATDRESQALITGMWAAAQINSQIQVNFKSGSGFVTIGAAQVAKIAAAVAGYVQACFTAEAQVVAGITGGTVKTLADVDAVFAAVTVPSAS